MKSFLSTSTKAFRHSLSCDATPLLIKVNVFFLLFFFYFIFAGVLSLSEDVHAIWMISSDCFCHFFEV